jgi:Tol biopolymer transport system component
VSRAAIARVIVLAIALGSCGPGEVRGPGVGTGASFILANPSGLVALDAACKPMGNVVGLPPQAAPSSPALHPNGKAIAFALTGQPDPRTGFGSDIYTVGLDGSGLRAILSHESENVFYASPRYDPTGLLLYVHRRAAIVKEGVYVGNEDTIERVDLRTNERLTVLREAADHVLSPDGRTIIYVRYVNGQIDSLWRANADGSGARPFFQTRDSFWYIQAPRFSPDGASLIFSAAGHSSGSVPARVISARGPGPRQAHLGVPSDLFLAPVDGSALRSVATTGDDVTPAWSPDGSRVAFVATGALHVLNVQARSTNVCAEGDNFFFGDLLWLR